MTKRGTALVLAAVFAWAPAYCRGAGDEQAEKPVTKVKVTAKQYKAVRPLDVYRAVIQGTRADVRFRDAFEAGRFPPGLRRAELDDREYRIALEFRTASNLSCLVPESSTDAIRRLLGLSSQQPLTEQALGGRWVVRPGQQMTVEGTILGTRGTGRYILVDYVALGARVARSTRREVQILLPGRGEPAVFGGAGFEKLQFPCSRAQDKTEELQVLIQEMTPEAALTQAARLAGTAEGLPGELKTYGEYEAGTVYQHAGADRAVNVDFTDEIVTVLSIPLPSSLRTAPSRRGERVVQLPVTHAFETAGRVTCLVPGMWPTLGVQAERLIPGETVRIRGTTLGARGARNRVLVDYLAFPAGDETETRGKSLWVAVWLGEKGPRAEMWDYGIYAQELPCQHVPGRYEPISVWIREYHEIVVPAPKAAEPAPQPAGEK